MTPDPITVERGAKGWIVLDHRELGTAPSMLGGYFVTKAKAQQRACHELHTPEPQGYHEREMWAEGKSKTHTQQQCPVCGLWRIWVPVECPRIEVT